MSLIMRPLQPQHRPSRQAPFPLNTACHRPVQCGWLLCLPTAETPSLLQPAFALQPTPGHALSPTLLNGLQ